MITIALVFTVLFSSSTPNNVSSLALDQQQHSIYRYGEFELFDNTTFDVKSNFNFRKGFITASGAVAGALLGVIPAVIILGLPQPFSSASFALALVSYSACPAAGAAIAALFTTNNYGPVLIAITTYAGAFMGTLYGAAIPFIVSASIVGQFSFFALIGGAILGATLASSIIAGGISGYYYAE